LGAVAAEWLGRTSNQTEWFGVVSTKFKQGVREKELQSDQYHVKEYGFYFFLYLSSTIILTCIKI
jgi:hypothetical protein